MGWWATTIMGGDTPLDFEDEFFELVGIKKSYEDNPTPESDLPDLIFKFNKIFLNNKMIEIAKRWIGYKKGKYMEDELNNMISIGYQVLAYIFMTNGVKLDNDLKVKMLKWIPKDNWELSNLEREKNIKELIEKLTKYDGSVKIVLSNQNLLDLFKI